MLSKDEQAWRLPWDGCLNARDVGGYPTANGGLIRKQALIRSDSLHNLTPEALAAVCDYGVRTVVDLRLAHELDTYPSPFATRQPHGPLPRYLNLPIHDMATGALIDAADSTATTYIIILERGREAIASIIKAVADSLQEGGVLVHCQGGKDRTGIIVALLLSVAGVEREVIARDYALSEVLLEPSYQEWVQEQVKLHGRVPTKPRQAQTSPVTIYAVFDYLDRQYGGVEGYLREVGVTQPEMAQIRNHLVTPHVST
jgi:protein-tyrosine phosphatase